MPEKGVWAKTKWQARGKPRRCPGGAVQAAGSAVRQPGGWAWEGCTGSGETQASLCRQAGRRSQLRPHTLGRAAGVRGGRGQTLPVQRPKGKTRRYERS